MSKKQSLDCSRSTYKKTLPCDPHFRRLYYKIDRLVKEGKIKEEILKKKSRIKPSRFH